MGGFWSAVRQTSFQESERNNQEGRLEKASGEEDVILQNSIILIPERTKQCLISILPIGLYFLFYAFVIDVSETEWEKTWPK